MPRSYEACSTIHHSAPGTTRRCLPLLLALCGLMSACASIPVATCSVDPGLIRPLTIPPKPPRAPVNGDLLNLVEDLREQIVIDNARKRELDQQTRACSQ